MSSDSQDPEKHNLAKKFDLTLVDGEFKAPVVYDPPDKDYDIARQNVHQANELAMKMMQQLSVIAETSMHPRAYEVFTQLFKSIVESNKDLLELQRLKLENNRLGQVPNEENRPQTQVNNLILTTAELAQMLKEAELKRNAEKDNSGSS